VFLWTLAFLFFAKNRKKYLDNQFIFRLGYECDCIEGLSGEDCSYDDFCFNNNRCEHGVCNPIKDYYECDCSDTGFTGENCETDVNECEEDNFCNSGECINSLGNFTCDCQGMLCEKFNIIFEQKCISRTGSCGLNLLSFTFAA
jgi:hypothetical protein